MFSFEKLSVWNKSRELNKKIYSTTLSFPKAEQFGLTSQLRRASISVTLNIAEGTSRFSGKEQARFTEIAFSSLMEVLSASLIANDLEYLTENDLTDIRELIKEISKMLSGLRKTQLQRKP